ncbi:MAG: alpha/beta hydrolase [Desulfarculus sp.]|nr:alpha/beta hydrolase [Pseudomonadota bacterium]MBU4598019.1 alpha/beta hydrolase [Pseudomonadota bacterium]MBV1717994.1 alpha/beta hydrolase [Desulfarculus sp.]MBV1739392.1 alpha/beta hydrolase [Desulfarculus sp.]MBV1751107.1 alpha/beta hydrolase [Desulfarculus sp.]
MNRRLKILAACLIALMLLLPVTAQAGQGAYANLDGHKVYYTDQGKGEPTLVLIHGWICNHKFWREQIPALAKNHRVIALDMIGCGKSDAPQVAYTQELLARSVLAVMDQAKVKDPVLIGHSMGLDVARRVALEHPTRVRALVSMDGALGLPPQEAVARAEWCKQADAFAAQFQGPDGQQKLGPFFDAMQDKSTPQALREWVKAQALATPWHVGKSSMAEFVKPANWDYRTLSIPVLAIYVPNPHLPPDFEAWLRTLFPNLRCAQITGAGHFVMLEKPGQVNALLLEFVDSKAVREKKTSK